VRPPIALMAPSWQGAQMVFLGSLYMVAMGLQMQQSMLPLPSLLPPPPFGCAMMLTASWTPLL